MGITFRSAARWAAALAVLAPPAAPALLAQTSGIERILRERQRVMVNREVEEGLRKPAERRKWEEAERLAFAQIKEDYERIQLANNELAEAVANPEGADLKLVAKSTAEIERRAERLLSNLALPELPADLERVRMPAGGQGQLRPSLLMLGRLVNRFVRSPLFREVNVIDAQISVRTRRDLEGIIELSGRLKKESEQFDKGSR
jgi:hypothetical protein